jgi:DNA-binding transcriptional regulator YhcF (GntR family)
MAQAVTIPLAELPLTPDEVERARGVDFGVDREAELPVGTQLDWRMRGMMASGSLRPGDRLPSVRELAAFAGVNVNTARAVYGDLEAEGFIASEQGRGTFVADRAGELRRAGEIAERAMAEARAEGVDPRLVATALYAAAPGPAMPAVPEPFPEPDPELSESQLRKVLREQIGKLELELSNYAWHDPQGPAPDLPRGGGPVARIAGVGDLERTRAALIDRLRRLRGEAATRADREEVARGLVEDMAADPSAYHWVRVDNADLGETACGEYRVVPTWGPLGAIMGWWRVKVSSGCPLSGR